MNFPHYIWSHCLHNRDDILCQNVALFPGPVSRSKQPKSMITRASVVMWVYVFVSAAVYPHRLQIPRASASAAPTQCVMRLCVCLLCVCNNISIQSTNECSKRRIDMALTRCQRMTRKTRKHRQSAILSINVINYLSIAKLLCVNTIQFQSTSIDATICMYIQANRIAFELRSSSIIYTHTNMFSKVCSSEF